MQKPYQRRWLIFWLCFITAAFGLFIVQAALLDLDAFVSFSIFDESGLNIPLPDGAYVLIIGSGDNIVLNPGGLVPFGSPTSTDFVWNSVSGDDVILGGVRIGDNNSSNGTFTSTVQYNPDDINYAYIRFFNWTQYPNDPTGLVFWGTSAIYELVPTLGVARVDFNPNQTLQSTNLNNFIVIPEPGTGNLMILFFAVLGGIRARMKRQEREEAEMAAR